MLQKIMITMLAVIAVSFGSSGFAETKAVPAKPAKAKAAAPAKETAKPAAVNPLLGRWVGDNGGSGVEITFTADKATFTAYIGEGGREKSYVMTYKYSKTPLALQYKDERGKIVNVSLSYKIAGDTLSYRFVKAPADMTVEIYKKRTPEGWGAATEITVEKREQEKAAEPYEGGH